MHIMGFPVASQNQGLSWSVSWQPVGMVDWGPGLQSGVKPASKHLKAKGDNVVCWCWCPTIKISKL